jgi:hypothetical protein
MAAHVTAIPLQGSEALQARVRGTIEGKENSFLSYYCDNLAFVLVFLLDHALLPSIITSKGRKY